MKKFSKYIYLLLSLIILTGCGASANTAGAPMESTTESANYSNNIDGVKDGDRDFNLKTDAENRKIIKNYNISFQSKEYDKALKDINALLEKYSGYATQFEEENYDTRSSTISLNVPAENADDFISELEANEGLNLLNKSLNSEDVTDTYEDQELRLKTQREKLERLNSMAEKEADLENLLKLEDEITETIYRIEGLERDLKNLDGRISHSKIILSLFEISANRTAYQEPGFFSQVGLAFSRTFKSFGSFMTGLVVNLIYLLPYIILIGIIVFISKKFIHKGKFSDKKFFSKFRKNKDSEKEDKE